MGVDRVNNDEACPSFHITLPFAPQKSLRAPCCDSELVSVKAVHIRIELTSNMVPVMRRRDQISPIVREEVFSFPTEPAQHPEVALQISRNAEHLPGALTRQRFEIHNID